MFMGQTVSGGNLSGTVNSLRDTETLKCLRDIKLLCKYVQTCSWDKMYQGEMSQGQ